MYALLVSDIFSCVEQLYEYSSMIEECIPATTLAAFHEPLQSVRDIMLSLQEELETRTRESAMGRPSLVIEEELLLFFVDNGFNVEDMAVVLGCSKRSRLSMYSLSTRNYTVITDVELDELIQEMSSVFPRCGEKLVHGRLRSRGIYVQRQ